MGVGFGYLLTLVHIQGLFFLSEPVAFRRVYGLESYLRTSGELNRHRQSVSGTGVPRYQLHHEDDYTLKVNLKFMGFPKGWHAIIGRVCGVAQSGDPRCTSGVAQYGKLRIYNRVGAESQLDIQ